MGVPGIGRIAAVPLGTLIRTSKPFRDAPPEAVANLNELIMSYYGIEFDFRRFETFVLECCLYGPRKLPEYGGPRERWISKHEPLSSANLCDCVR
jgi:hypothetical protein